MSSNSSESTDKTTYVLNPSLTDQSTVYLVPSSASVHNTTDIPVAVQLPIFDGDSVHPIQFCATFDPRPPALQPLTVEPCFDGRNTTTPHKSQDFAYNEKTGAVRPMWFLGENDGTVKSQLSDSGDTNTTKIDSEGNSSAFEHYESSRSNFDNKISDPASTSNFASTISINHGEGGKIVARGGASTQNLTLVFVPSSTAQNTGVPQIIEVEKVAVTGTATEHQYSQSTVGRISSSPSAPTHPSQSASGTLISRSSAASYTFLSSSAVSSMGMSTSSSGSSPRSTISSTIAYSSASGPASSSTSTAVVNAATSTTDPDEVASEIAAGAEQSSSSTIITSTSSTTPAQMSSKMQPSATANTVEAEITADTNAYSSAWYSSSDTSDPDVGEPSQTISSYGSTMTAVNTEPYMWTFQEMA